MQPYSFRFCIRQDPVSLDPRKGNDMIASQIHFMLYEGLYRLEEDMTLTAAQAKNCEISPDKKRYTFALGCNTWSDGSPVTAYDFERSWKKMLDPNFPSPDSYLLYSIKNAKLAKTGGCSLDKVAIHAQDAKTLIVELDHPAPYFLQIFASSFLLPIHATDDTSAFLPTLFNGPFKLIKWEFHREIILEKNPLYRNAANIQLHQMNIEILDREMAALSMYANGYFDLIGAPLSFFPASLRHDLEQKKLVATYPIATTKFLSFNTKQFPFSNANIRRAFSYAIDRGSISKHITQFNEKEATHIVPPNLLSIQTPLLSTQAEPKKAKEWMELGLKELNQKIDNVSLMYCSSEINKLLTQKLQQEWSQTLGVSVSLEHVDFKTLHERSGKGDFSIGLFALLADYGDPMNILERFIDTTNHRNYAKWENEEYNHLLREAIIASTHEEYLSLLEKAESLLIHEMPVAPLIHENYLFLISSRVKGFAVSPLGHIYFERIFLSE